MKFKIGKKFTNKRETVMMLQKGNYIFKQKIIVQTKIRVQMNIIYYMK